MKARPVLPATVALWVLLCAMATVAVMSAPAGGGPAASPKQEFTGYVHAETWPLAPGGELLDVALSSDNLLYVANATARAVHVYDASGERVRTLLRPPDVRADAIPAAVVAGVDTVHIVWFAPGANVPPFSPLRGTLDTRSLAGEAIATQPLALPDHDISAAIDPLSGTVFIAGPLEVATVDAVQFTVFRVGQGLVDARQFVMPAGARPRLAAYDERLAVPVEDGAIAWFDWTGAQVDLWPGPTPAVHLADIVATGDGSVVGLAYSDELEGAAAVVHFAPDGMVSPVWTQTEQPIAAPRAFWPWAIDAKGESLAVLTGEMVGPVYDRSVNVRAEWLRGDGSVAVRVDGAPFQVTQSGHVATQPKSALALAALSDGAMAVGKEGTRSAVVLDSAGGLARQMTLPGRLVDLSADGDTLFASFDDGLVARIGVTSTVTPTWQADCLCSLGGRIAAGTGALYATRPVSAAVGAWETTSGAAIGQIALGDAVGMWPADVVVGTDGRLYTADIVTAQVQAWLNPAAPDVTWQAGLLAGPRRLAAGLSPDGVPLIGAYMADGFVELHTTDGGLLWRWEPKLIDGQRLRVSDIAVGTDGRVYLADVERQTVEVFAPGLVEEPTPALTPSVTPTPSDRSCLVEGDKVAGPPRIVLGETAAVTLTIAADCPGNTELYGADIVLLMDTSGSMTNEPIAAAQGAARAFVELLDVRYHRVGLVSFASNATVHVPLTDDSAAVVSAIVGLRASGGTNMIEGLHLAGQNLDDFGRADALAVVIVLSDGQPAMNPVPEATLLKNRGILLYTIGLGASANQTLLRDVASTPDRAYYAPSPADLYPIYSEILRAVLSSLAGNLVIDDTMGDNIVVVPDTVQPRGLESATRLRWSRSLLPSSGITLTYRILPQVPGILPTNREAVADYTDGDGVRRRFVFPVPEIEVITPTPTPTATPTPPPEPIYLPVTANKLCLGRQTRSDVVLLIDTSSSMTVPKLSAAKSAALAFIEQLELPLDQAAVFGFHRTVDREASLMTDEAALFAAVHRLSSHEGTRIDTALEAARDELATSPRRRATNRGVAILLSDGAHNGPSGVVVEAAGRLKAAGVRVFAIGLGAEADETLLRAVADPNSYFFSPDESQLRQIYAAIAVRIPCR